MIYYRALGPNLRDNFSDVLLGLHIREEMDSDEPLDIPHETTRDTPAQSEPMQDENALAYIIRMIGGDATLALLRIKAVVGTYDLKDAKMQAKLGAYARQIKEGANVNDLFPAPKDELPEFDAAPNKTEDIPAEAAEEEGEIVEATDKDGNYPEPAEVKDFVEVPLLKDEPAPPVIKKTRAKKEAAPAPAPDPEPTNPKEILMSLLDKAAAKFPGVDQSDILGVITKGAYDNLEFATPDDFKKCFGLVHDYCVTKKLISA
jgi:hypothetical protein